jgi:K+-sensing histidine kinase KdpD
MNEMTFFASAERTGSEDIKAKNALISSLEKFVEIFGAVNGLGAVLDKNRQVVFANNDFIKTFGFDSMEALLGKRPGEAISCLHSGELPSGCGTTEACSVCGAVNAIMESQVKGVRTSRETRITSVIDGQNKSWDLKVTSTPFKLSDEVFYLFMVEDISDQKRRVTLERIFFHDLLNIAGSLNGLLSILKDGTDPDQTKAIINISEEASRNLVEEIMFLRQIQSAENGDLQVKIEKINSIDFLNSAVNKMKYHDSANGRIITIDEDSANQEFESDRILLQRVMINLLKNALEATPEGGIVNAGCRSEGQKIHFFVKNSTVMPIEAQLQVFQRSFSTKEIGRGIGTYSVKLLTENYLRGNVSFVSNEAQGTVFTLIL